MKSMQLACPRCSAQFAANPDDCGIGVHCSICSTEIRIPSIFLETGAVLGNFRIERALGAGAMADVFLATQISMDRLVALKIASPHAADPEELREQFRNEVVMTGKFEHPHIINAIDCGEQDGLIFLAMRYIDGTDLDVVLGRRRRLREDEVLSIAKQMAEALGYAWERAQVLHCDIKPGNIMLDDHGKASLMDMGIAMTVAQANEKSGDGYVLGTPAYMSPEQATDKADIDFRSDMYALGATLFHLVTGQQPFQGPTPEETMVLRLHNESPAAQDVLPEVSDGLNALLARLLSRWPDDRHDTWEALKGDIERIEAGKMPRRPGEEAPEKSVKKKKPSAGGRAKTGMQAPSKPRPKRSATPYVAPKTDNTFFIMAMVFIVVVGITAGIIAYMFGGGR